MFDITLITMGKLKEKFYISAVNEYEKRLQGYCQFKLLELPEVRLPEPPSPADIRAGLEKEADMILQKIPKGAWFCVLTPEGKMLSSESLAEKIANVKSSGKSSVCYLIGSSFGIAQRIKDQADFKLSMSTAPKPFRQAVNIINKRDALASLLKFSGCVHYCGQRTKRCCLTAQNTASQCTNRKARFPCLLYLRFFQTSLRPC